MLLPHRETKTEHCGRIWNAPLRGNLPRFTRRGDASSFRELARSSEKKSHTARNGRAMHAPTRQHKTPVLLGRGGACSSRIVKPKPNIAGAYGMRPYEVTYPASPVGATRVRFANSRGRPRRNLTPHETGVQCTPLRGNIKLRFSLVGEGLAPPAS